MTGDDRDSARSGAAGSGHDRSAFEKEFAFYASYHTESRNQAVHFVFVPQIYWSFLVVLLAVFGDLSASLPPMALKVLTADGALGAFSGATIVVWVYTLWYQRLHTVLGVSVHDHRAWSWRCGVVQTLPWRLVASPSLRHFACADGP